jgi:hypothetical protein
LRADRLKTKKMGAKDMSWEEAGRRAFNRYFNVYRKTEDHDDGQELAGDEIANAMIDAGIEIENLWYEELPVDAWLGVFKGFSDAYKNIEKEVGYEPSELFMGPVHTWFSDAMFYSNEVHQDPRLEGLIEEFNKL